MAFIIQKAQYYGHNLKAQRQQLQRRSGKQDYQLGKETEGNIKPHNLGEMGCFLSNMSSDRPSYLMDLFLKLVQGRCYHQTLSSKVRNYVSYIYIPVFITFLLFGMVNSIRPLKL